MTSISFNMSAPGKGAAASQQQQQQPGQLRLSSSTGLGKTLSFPHLGTGASDLVFNFTGSSGGVTGVNVTAHQGGGSNVIRVRSSDILSVLEDTADS